MLDWVVISFRYILTEEYIERYKDYVDWEGVSGNQKITKEFIDRNYMNIDFITLKYNDYIPINLKYGFRSGYYSH